MNDSCRAGSCALPGRTPMALHVHVRSNLDLGMELHLHIYCAWSIFGTSTQTRRNRTAVGRGGGRNHLPRPIQHRWPKLMYQCVALCDLWWSSAPWHLKEPAECRVIRQESMEPYQSYLPRPSGAHMMPLPAHLQSAWTHPPCLIHSGNPQSVSKEYGQFCDAPPIWWHRCSICGLSVKVHRCAGARNPMCNMAWATGFLLALHLHASALHMVGKCLQLTLPKWSYELLKNMVFGNVHLMARCGGMF